MKITEAIRHRRSVRTFDGNALRPEDAQRILEFAQTADSPYEIPIRWRLLDGERDGLNAPVITGCRNYIAGKLMRVPHAEEAFGFAFERVLLYAQTLGIGSTWIAGTMNRRAFEKEMELAEGEVMPCISPLGYPTEKMSLRETMMRKGVGADARLPFDELFFDGSFDSVLTPDRAGDFSLPFAMVRLAPSAVNKQPWRIVLDHGKVHFYERQNRGYVSDGWDLQKIDLGIAMCHFALSAEECGLDVRFRLEDPGLSAPEGTRYIATYETA